MIIFLASLFAIGISYMTLDRVFNVLPNYNSMGTIIEAWYPNYIHIYNQDISMKTQFSLDNFMICTLSFVEYILLLWALYTQWNVETDYSIFKEVLLITITWMVCNTALNFVWILNGTIITN